MQESPTRTRTQVSVLTTPTKAAALRTARATAMCGISLLTRRTVKSAVSALPPRTAAQTECTIPTGICPAEELTLTAVLWIRSGRHTTLLSGGIFRIRSSTAGSSSGFIWAGCQMEMCGSSESIFMTGAFMKSLCSTPCR